MFSMVCITSASRPLANLIYQSHPRSSSPPAFARVIVPLARKWLLQCINAVDCVVCGFFQISASEFTCSSIYAFTSQMLTTTRHLHQLSHYPHYPVYSAYDIQKWLIWKWCHNSSGANQPQCSGKVIQNWAELCNSLKNVVGRYSLKQTAV